MTNATFSNAIYIINASELLGVQSSFHSSMWSSSCYSFCYSVGMFGTMIDARYYISKRSLNVMGLCRHCRLPIWPYTHTSAGHSTNKPSHHSAERDDWEIWNHCTAGPIKARDFDYNNSSSSRDDDKLFDCRWAGFLRWWWNLDDIAVQPFNGTSR